MSRYAGSVAARPRLDPSAYISDSLKKKLWTPFEVPAYFQPGVFFGYIWGDISKTSAFHVREGDAYEGKAVLFHNPAQVFDLDDMSTYGHLNNLSAAELASLKTKMNKIKKDLSEIKGDRAAQRRKVYVNSLSWNEKPVNVDFIEQGRKTLHKIFKYGGHFNKAHFSSIELRNYERSIFERGKGTEFIDPDYVIVDPPKSKNSPDPKLNRGRIVLVELKKGLGKDEPTPDEAQQLRKAAALARKWGLEIWGHVPIIELYFVGGRATMARNVNFRRNETAEINRRKAIEIESSGNMKNGTRVVPKYIATPISVITGRGLADLLYLDPAQVALLTTNQTRAFFIDTEKLINYIDDNPDKYPIQDTTRTVDLKKDPEFVAMVLGMQKGAWAPPTGVLKNFDGDIRKVGKLLGYIKARRLAIKNAAVPANKKAIYKQNVKQTIRVLLGNKYKNYLENNTKTKLNRIAANYTKEGVKSPANLKTPSLGEALLSPVLARRGQFKVGPKKNAVGAKVQRLRVQNFPIRSKALFPNNIMNEALLKPVRGEPQPKKPYSPKITSGNIKVVSNDRLTRLIMHLYTNIQTAYNRGDQATFRKNKAKLVEIGQEILSNPRRSQNLKNYVNTNNAFKMYTTFKSPATNRGAMRPRTAPGAARVNRGNNLPVKSPAAFDFMSISQKWPKGMKQGEMAERATAAGVLNAKEVQYFVKNWTKLTIGEKKSIVSKSMRA